jgi:protein-S-isoprenylcysteine O-methyltransferase Ste14
VSAWRHARAIILLPGTVIVLVPALIVIVGGGPNIGWGLGGVLVVLVALVGLMLVAAGLALWMWTLGLFARIGKGTLASWDPTRQLVVQGPYRRVRNPMITGVLTILVGQAALWGSPGLLVWCAAFFAIYRTYCVRYEEPGLERRFGEEYRAYRHSVPRWIPRRTPWAPAG